MATILILQPTKHFDIISAELKRVASPGEFMMVEGRVRSEDLYASQEPLLHQLAMLCEELQPSPLYARYANRKVFKHEEEFWKTTETTVRNHVKQMADKRLVKVIQLATTLHIAILYVTDKKAALNISESLHLDSNMEVTPLMNFHRHDSGTSYCLQLRIGNKVVDQLSEHQLAVLTYAPATFVLDGTIYSLGEGFSGKLLIPFIKKSIVDIPQRMEDEYFRRFILKHVARAEISADGFDITDVQVPLQPCLHMESAIDGSRLLTLRFKYGDRTYNPDYNSKGRVMLTESDNTFCFVRQLRDLQAESDFLSRLQQTDKRISARGDIRFTSLSELVAWLRQHGATLKEQGFDVVQPSDHLYYIGPLSVEQNDTWHGDWLQTDVTVVIDGGKLRIPFRDLRDTILRNEQEYMLPTGERLLIPHEWLERYSDLLLVGMPKGQGFLRHRSQVVQEAPDTDTEHGASTAYIPYTRAIEGKHVSPPTFHASSFTLRPYQQNGFQWLWQNMMAQTGCCLSDEMGLGKTIQTIALLLTYKEQYKTKAPQQMPQPGMLFSEEEMQGGAGNSSTTEASPKGLQPAFSYSTSLVVAPASVVHNWGNELARFAPSLQVMNYTGDIMKRREKQQVMMRWDVVLTSYRTLLNDIDVLARQQFGIIVFDESQTFKTPTSQIHQAVTRLKAFHRMALSGTPVENNLSELWSLMNVLNPNLLGKAKAFQEAFVNPIARQMEENRRILLRRLIAPYFLKRTKEEVLSDLPERQDEVVRCTMTESQTSEYAAQLSRARNEWLDPQASLQHRQMNMLAALQKLRQIANGEGKMDVVFKYLENLRSTHHKVLIFSEYVTLIERVSTMMQSRGWTYAMLTGRTQQREEVIAHFQQSDDCQFFLISLKAGGVGLNLTAADYVFLLDPWWNHAAEEQAIARAHRIGQHHPVFVYRFVAAGTLEEQILTLQDRKQSLIDSVMPFVCGEQL